MCTASTIDGQHVFELAGLGKAPFKFIGFEEKIFTVPPFGNDPGYSKPGGTCWACSTALQNCFWLQSADGKKFYVGCECLKKSGDRGLIRLAQDTEKKRKREQRHAREASNLETLKAEFEAVREIAKGLPSPNEYYASKGQTLADSVDWYLDRAGMTGKLAALRSAIKTCRS